MSTAVLLWLFLLLSMTQAQCLASCDSPGSLGNTAGPSGPHFLQTTSRFDSWAAGVPQCVPFQTATLGGSTVVVAVAMAIQGQLTISDDKGNLYVQKGTAAFEGEVGQGRIFTFLALNANAGVSEVYITSDTGTFMDVFITEYQGLGFIDPATPALIVGEAVLGDGFASTVTTSATVSCSAALLYVFYEAKHVVTSIPATFTVRSDCGLNRIADQVVTSPGQYGFTGTASTGSSVIMMPLCLQGATVPSTFTVAAGSTLNVPQGGLLLESVFFEGGATLVVPAGSALQANGTIALASTNILITSVTQSGAFVVITTSGNLTGVLGSVQAQSGCGGSASVSDVNVGAVSVTVQVVSQCGAERSVPVGLIVGVTIGGCVLVVIVVVVILVVSRKRRAALARADVLNNMAVAEL